MKPIRPLLTCKLDEGKPVSPHVLKMINHLENMKRLGCPYSQELDTDIILLSLPKEFSNFRLNFNMQGMSKSLFELHGMLKTAQQELPKLKRNRDVLMVQKGKRFKKSGKGKQNHQVKGKGKVVASNVPKKGASPDQQCFYCNGKGHWKRNCPKYLKDMKDGVGPSNTPKGIYMIEICLTNSTSWVLDTGCGAHICANV